jgi:cyclopropane fatty-acyl-phospholipid synthase-like methyltransferase
MNIATQRYVSGTYLEHHPTWHIEDSPWKADQVLKALREAHLNPKTIAEVGCGAGAILSELQTRLPLDTQFAGYEISEDALKLCRLRANDRLQFYLGDLSSVDVKFDVLLMMDVVEHIEDYFGFLRQMREKAEIKIAHLPLDMTVHSLIRGLPLLERRIDGHLHYFNKDTALATFSDCGYEILHWFFTPKVDLARSLRYRVTSQIRRLFYSVAPGWSADVLGGFGLMVVAR